MLKFKDVELSDSVLFEEYAQPLFGLEACFGNIYIWRKAWDIKIANDEQALYVLMENDEPSFMLPPFMKNEKDSMCVPIEKCEEYMKNNYGIPLLLKGVTPPIKERIERDCPGSFEFSEDRCNYEYVYNRDDLANLTGKKFHSKRNHINRLLAKHSFEYKPFSKEYYDECIDLQNKWVHSKGGLNEDFEDELVVAKEAFANMEALKLRCGLLFIDGELAAFSIGEKYRNSAVIHIEKADPEVPGAFNLINREFVRNAWEDVEYINREEDMGIEGMRRSKLSYNPVYLVEKFDCVRK